MTEQEKEYLANAIKKHQIRYAKGCEAYNCLANWLFELTWKASPEAKETENITAFKKLLTDGVPKDNPVEEAKPQGKCRAGRNEPVEEKPKEEDQFIRCHDCYNILMKKENAPLTKQTFTGKDEMWSVMFQLIREGKYQKVKELFVIEEVSKEPEWTMEYDEDDTWVYNRGSMILYSLAFVDKEEALRILRQLNS